VLLDSDTSEQHRQELAPAGELANWQQRCLGALAFLTPVPLVARCASTTPTLSVGGCHVLSAGAGSSCPVRS
jgi:hypothetical protein